MTPDPRNPAPASRKKGPAETPAERIPTEDHEGATDDQVGDTGGPGVGYDQEPEQAPDEGGVS